MVRSLIGIKNGGAYYMSYIHNTGVDDSLLFFFLILIMLFCNPSIFGCGTECGVYAGDSQTPCGC